MTKEEIIDKIKRDYPIGTKFIPAHIPNAKDVICEVFDYDKLSVGNSYARLYSLDRRNPNTYTGEVFYNGVWAEIISKPEPKIDFIPGKWYKNIKEKGYYCKLSKIIESKDRFEVDEHVKPGGKFEKRNTWFRLSDGFNLIDIKEIQSFLPEGHVDLIKQESMEMIEGQWYKFFSKTSNKEWLIKYDGIESEYCKQYKSGSLNPFSAYYNRERWGKKDSMENIKLANMEEVYTHFPEERPKVEAGIEKLEEGKFYYIDWTNGNSYIVNGGKKNESLNSDKFSNNGGFNIKSCWKSIRFATTDEENWLKACIKADKFIPKEEALKPVIMENEDLVGRYLKALSDEPEGGTVKNGEVGKVKRNNHNGYWVVDFPSQKSYWCSEKKLQLYELMPIGWTPETPNTYGLKVGDILETKVLNKWSSITGNFCYEISKGWSGSFGAYSGGRKIDEFKTINGIVGFKVSNCAIDTHYVKAEGFKEFMDNFDKPKTSELTSLPDKWCIKFIDKADVPTLRKFKPFEIWTFGATGYYYDCSGKNCDSDVRGGYTEITFDQFKKWVLKGETEVPEISRYVKWIQYHSMGGTTPRYMCADEKFIEGKIFDTHKDKIPDSGYQGSDWKVFLLPKFYGGNFQPSTEAAYLAQNKPNMKESPKVMNTITSPCGKFKVGDFIGGNGFTNDTTYHEINKIEGDRFWIYYTPGKYEEIHNYRFSDFKNLKKREIVEEKCPEYVECIAGSGAAKYCKKGTIYKVEKYNPKTGYITVLGCEIANIYFDGKYRGNNTGNNTDYKPSTWEAYQQQEYHLKPKIEPMKEEEFKVGDWVVFLPDEAKKKSLFTSTWNKPWVLRITELNSISLLFSKEEAQRAGMSCSGGASNCISTFRKALPHEIPTLASEYKVGDIVIANCASVGSKLESYLIKIKSLPTGGGIIITGEWFYSITNGKVNATKCKGGGFYNIVRMAKYSEIPEEDRKEQKPAQITVVKKGFDEKEHLSKPYNQMLEVKIKKVNKKPIKLQLL